MAGTGSIDDYLAKVSEEHRALLEKLRKRIKAAAPKAVETISYQMPTFKYQGRALVGFAAFKNHCSLFPYSSTLLETFADELGAMRTSKGTIQFTVAKPIPPGLVKKIVKTRLREIDDQGK